MLKIDRFIFNLISENTYIVADGASKECIIIDPGCSDATEKNELSAFIMKNGLRLKAFFNTHCHVDHILGNRFLKETYNAEFLAPEEDVFLLDLMVKEAVNFGLKMDASPLPDRLIKEDLHFELGGREVKFLFTPGHSPGGYCLYFKDDKICFTGDTLFREGIGRTDLWGGDYEAIINSIETRLFSLPDDVVIYPGHGEKSTIGHEKTSNPFLA
ncbi:MAG: MBL fold metallo-hydrolase [Ignavibacteria bacterium]|jgi:glyoxylase-like metal-dependent hydrolase (beta-lactamase superfamily II)|nr:MBL fold metallo-hydrolase [Ignavibacteria bacterium]MCU7505023.1 MBL fold metallo-hydrolase [Ignavibacteria bacterium]MCU7515337.1 MBL fold metallo-hydrolase [Ignavibacteria bacterium]